MCNGCSSCERFALAGHHLWDKEFRGPNRPRWCGRVAQVNPAVCQGCGACTGRLSSGAMDLKGFSNAQILSMLDYYGLGVDPCGMGLQLWRAPSLAATMNDPL